MEGSRRPPCLSCGPERTRSEEDVCVQGRRAGFVPHHITQGLAAGARREGWTRRTWFRLKDGHLVEDDEADLKCFSSSRVLAARGRERDVMAADTSASWTTGAS